MNRDPKGFSLTITPVFITLMQKLEDSRVISSETAHQLKKELLHTTKTPLENLKELYWLHKDNHEDAEFFSVTTKPNE